MKVIERYQGLIPCQLYFAYPWHDIHVQEKEQAVLHTFAYMPLPADKEAVQVKFTRARRPGPYHIVTRDDVAIISSAGGPVVTVWRHQAPFEPARPIEKPKRFAWLKRRGWVEETFDEFCRRVRLTVLGYKPGFPVSPD